jgi:hypothetical protein
MNEATKLERRIGFFRKKPVPAPAAVAAPRVTLNANTGDSFTHSLNPALEENSLPLVSTRPSPVSNNPPASLPSGARQIGSIGQIGAGSKAERVLGLHPSPPRPPVDTTSLPPVATPAPVPPTLGSKIGSFFGLRPNPSTP